MKKMNNQKELKGNPTLEHIMTMDLLRRGFLMKYSKCTVYRMGKSYKCFSNSEHFSFVSVYMEIHRLVEEFNPSSGLSGFFFSQMSYTSKSPKQPNSYNFPSETVLTLNLFIV